MIVLAIIVAALLAAAAWGEVLAHRYAEQVSPGALTQGLSLLAGWTVIAFTAATAVLIVVYA